MQVHYLYSMKSTQITIKDIARELKISPSTVSRALKNHPDISPATKKAVRELAERLDYQPNSVALSLRKSKTFTIGVIIPEIVHHFFSTVISGIEEVAYGANYHVMICQSNESYEREKMNVQALYASRVDGMLVSVSKETTDFQHFQSIFNRNIPLVFFDRVVEGLPTSTVVVDDFGGAYGATEHLIKSGAKRVALLGGPANLGISQSRKKGYTEALRASGQTIDEAYMVDCGLTIEEGRKACARLLALPEPPDAIFAVNDPLAFGAMQYAKEKGLSIPGELAIVGFSNEPLTSLIDPPLTTVAQPGFAMGEMATRLLLEEIEKKDKDETAQRVEKTLETELIIRSSTKK